MTRPSNLQVTTKKRNQRKSGPTSSEQINDFQSEVIRDLSALQFSWNNFVVPLTATIPDGTDDPAINAFSTGLDGKTLYVKSDATSTFAFGRYYNVVKDRPNTVYEQLTNVYTYIDDQIALVGTASTGVSTGGVVDHGLLTGLTDNDHPQYQLISGKNTANGYAGLDSGSLINYAQLPIFTSGLRGAVPASGVGSTAFLRQDGTWVVPSTGIDGSGAATRLTYWSDADTITSSANLTYDGTTFSINSAAVFNDAAADRDFRIESQADANLFFTDASALTGNIGAVGVGTNTPTSRLHVKSPNTNNADFGRIVAEHTNANSYASITLRNSSSVDGTVGYTGTSYAGLGHTASPTGEQMFISCPAAPIVFDNGAYRLGILTSEVVFNEPGLDYDFRIEGQTDANLFFVDASAGRVGIGTSTPSSFMEVVAGTRPAGEKSFFITSTMTHSGTSFYANEFRVTSAGTLGGSQYALVASLLAGYTGVGSTVAFVSDNSAAGTGTYSPFEGQSLGIAGGANLGYWGQAIASTTGTNMGGFNRAYGGAFSVGSYGVVGTNDGTANNGFRVDSTNIGATGVVVLAKNASSTTEKHIGVLGLALNGNTTVAGYFGLQATAPTLANAALMADNGATSSDILVARDNGTKIFSIPDGGSIEIAETVAPSTPSSGYGRIYEKSDGYLYFKNDAGIEYDLTASGTGTITGTGSSGAVAFWTGTSAISEDPTKFFWDSGNNRLGIGTAAPTSDLEINGGTSIPELSMITTGSGSYTQIYLKADGTDNGRLNQYGSAVGSSIASVSTNNMFALQKVGANGPLLIGGQDNFTLYLVTSNRQRLNFGPAGGAAVFNETAEDYDFRVEGQTASSLIFADASADFVGINNGSPAQRLDVVGNIKTSGYYEIAEIAAPSTPSSGSGRIYEKTDGILYFKNDAGTEYDLTASGLGGTLTGTGVDNQIAVWSGTTSQDSSSSLTWDGTTFAADGAAVFNETGADRDFRVEGDTDSGLFFIDASADFVGIGTNNPASKFQVAGSLGLPTTVTTSSNITLDSTYYTLRCNAVSNTITVNLPATSTCTGRIYNIKKIDSSANNVILDGSGTETIDGSQTVSIIQQYDSLTVQSNGTSWDII